jgi:predicted DNA-binding transcriptional regulator AlpA
VPKQSPKEKSAARTRYSDLALINATDLCEVLGVSHWTLDQWVERGLIPRPLAMTPGSPRQWRVVDVSNHIQKRKRSRRPKQKPRGAVRKHIERKAKRARKGGAS